MSKENLERVLDSANDSDWRIARTAWFRYNDIVGRIAAANGFSIEVGAAVFAALSPNNDYLGNLRDTSRLLVAAGAGRSIESFKVSTYGSNKRKAWRIALGEKPLDLIVFPKTRNFFLNILDPTDPVPVTVDGHIFNAWRGERMRLNDAAQKANARFYEQVAGDIRQIGAERGLFPNVVQGGVWYCWKRLHRIRHSDQMEFWGPDFMIAGLGFEPDLWEPAENGADEVQSLSSVAMLL